MNKEQLLTPFGVSKYTYLDEPYKPKKVRGDDKLNYKVTLLLDPDNDAEHKAFLGHLKKMTKEKGGELYPFERDYTQTKNDDGTKRKEYTGLWGVKMHSAFKPAVFDSAKNPIDPAEVGNGSVIRCAVGIKHFESFGRTPAGMTLYLNGVQVRELKPKGTSAEGFGFTEVEGGYTDEGYTGASDFAEQAKYTDEPEDFDAGSAEEFEETIPDGIPF